MTGVAKRKRLEEMWSLSAEGLNFREIGAVFSVSEQTVSYLFRRWGYPPGHKFLAADPNSARSKRSAFLNSECMKKHGVTFAELRVMRKNGVTAAYREHFKNARRRGVQWEFILKTWSEVWFNSGKWDKRGAGDGRYVMGRFGDQGPYSPSNVEIITFNQNCSDARANQKLKNVRGTPEGF